MDNIDHLNLIYNSCILFLLIRASVCMFVPRGYCQGGNNETVSNKFAGGTGFGYDQRLPGGNESNSNSNALSHADSISHAHTVSHTYAIAFTNINSRKESIVPGK